MCDQPVLDWQFDQARTKTMNESLDPRLIRKILLWASFAAFGTAALAVFLSGSGSLFGISCLVPWLLHRGFLPRNMPVLGRKKRGNFGFGMIIVSSFICVLHSIALLWTIGLLVLDHFVSTDSLVGGLFLILSLIGFFFIWIYTLNWFDRLNQIGYYQALSRAMAAISGPPLIIVILYSLKYSYTGSFFSVGSEIFDFQIFSGLIVGWCAVNLIWSLIPWLYLSILNKTYQQARLEKAQRDLFDLDALQLVQRIGTAEWFVPLTSSSVADVSNAGPYSVGPANRSENFGFRTD
jgi:hypothetical protein